jgi:hypothetical protein
MKLPTVQLSPLSRYFIPLRRFEETDMRQTRCASCIGVYRLSLWCHGEYYGDRDEHLGQLKAENSVPC